MSEHIVGGVTQLTATPLTDAAIKPYNNTLDGDAAVPACLARDLQRRLADAIRERDRLADRERSIISACERVADGGQYRADIVSAIDRIRRERDDARAALREMLEGMSGTYAVDCVDYKANDIKRWRKAAGMEDGQ